jgi:RHH-type transcriptional regulator, rel operon repressor / antitoxin RelB
MSQAETITIRFPAELKTKLAALATITNRSKSWLAAQAIATYVDEQSWQVQQIEEAVALADSDKAIWVPASKVNEWLASWGTSLCPIRWVVAANRWSIVFSSKLWALAA